MQNLIKQSQSQIFSTKILQNFSTIKPKQQKPKGKQLFRSLYFPLKKINFQNIEYHKIYLCQDFVKSDPIKSKLVAAYFSPFLLYGTNFLFFMDFSFLPHYAALGALGMFASVKIYRELLLLNSRIAEMWINKDGTEFILSQRYNNYFEKFNDNSIKEIDSQIHPVDRLLFKFSLDDVENMDLIKHTMEQEEINKNKKKSDIEKEQEENKKNNKNNENTFIITADMQQDTLLIQYKIDNELCTFYVDIDKNELNSYNDYLIALGMKQRLVMNQIN